MMRSSPDVNLICWGSFSLILLNLTIPLSHMACATNSGRVSDEP